MILDLILIVACAIFNRLGGSVNKSWRRIVIGIALAIYGILFHRYLGLLCIATSQLFRLPISLFGNGVEEHWFNRIWVFIVGFLFGLVPFPLCLPGHWLLGLESAGIFGLIYGIMVNLSNWKPTSKIFTWDRIEYIYGAMVAILAIIFRRREKK